MRLLITAGPTRENLDSVRFISNASSGKFGYAIAAEAIRRGHEVVLISGPVEVLAPPGAILHKIISAEEMLRVAEAEFADCDAAIMAAAVCDYRPVTRMGLKSPKQERSFSVELAPTEDICRRLGESKGNRVVIGFAMEDHDGHIHAERKLKKKHCDAIVLNGVSSMGSDSTQIEVFSQKNGWLPSVQGTKAKLAVSVMDIVENMVNDNIGKTVN